jgi:NAD(P)-dependent dehydrogenase (short-subunit alcohol dehydrogenase family)
MTPSSPFDLTGKIAIVTGASRGIGAEIAKLLAQHGAHVIVSSRKQADCQAVVDAIVADGGSAEAIACHIGEMEQIASLYEQVESRHGRLEMPPTRSSATSSIPIRRCSRRRSTSTSAATSTCPRMARG